MSEGGKMMLSSTVRSGATSGVGRPSTKRTARALNSESLKNRMAGFTSITATSTHSKARSGAGYCLIGLKHGSPRSLRKIGHGETLLGS